MDITTCEHLMKIIMYVFNTDLFLSFLFCFAILLKVLRVFLCNTHTHTHILIFIIQLAGIFFMSFNSHLISKTKKLAQQQFQLPLGVCILMEQRKPFFTFYFFLFRITSTANSKWMSRKISTIMLSLKWMKQKISASIGIH